MGTLFTAGWVVLFIAAVLAWVPRARPAALSLFAAGYVLAFTAGELDWRALAVIAVLLAAGLAVRSPRRPLLRIAGHVVFVLVALGAMQHLLPGFFNERVFGPARITPDAAPYSLWLNLDKLLIGIWVLSAIPWVEENRSPVTWFRTGILACAITAAICLVVGWSASYVAWQPKLPSIWWLWVLDNLLLVTFTEEALFRGYAQGGLQRAFGNTEYGGWVALAMASLLFGMAHAGGGAAYMMLATIAGVGYGLAYRAGGIQAARIAHFGVNALHFFLFTYPVLELPRI